MESDPRGEFLVLLSSGCVVILSTKLTGPTLLFHDEEDREARRCHLARSKQGAEAYEDIFLGELRGINQVTIEKYCKYFECHGAEVKDNLFLQELTENLENLLLCLLLFDFYILLILLGRSLSSPLDVGGVSSVFVSTSVPFPVTFARFSL